ncbi:hypothetical protein NDU88_006557 [Pleurodeles waltl]|uniref:Uncharacterized protein n=1 Tax=Pleurodeles waltl TaxID=8319 RepID=A0AAV7QKD8_PLEWA|nr:hypothetical protein NDU88_006557 [Pleurodeles waltl]
MALALNAAVQSILTFWGTDRVPTYVSWLQKLWFILAMEKLTLVSQQRVGDIGRSLEAHDIHFGTSSSTYKRTALLHDTVNYSEIAHYMSEWFAFALAMAKHCILRL